MQLAIGGGSTIDVAKAVGILATNGGRIHDYEGTEKFSTPGLPLIAVPSTAGTGSEVSGSCVITDAEQNRKMSIRHRSEAHTSELQSLMRISYAVFRLKTNRTPTH